MTTTPEAVTPPADADEQTQLTLFDAAREWVASLRAAFARAADITVLEARLAALSFTTMLIIAVASGLLLATGWIALFAAIVAWFHELGLSWSAALLLMATINIVLAITGGYAIYRMSNNLLFKAIRKFILYGEEKNAEEKNDEATKNRGEQNGAAESVARTPSAS